MGAFDIKRFAFDFELRQKDIADALGIDQPAVSMMMNGNRQIRPEHIELLKCKYGESVDSYIIDDTARQVMSGAQSRQVTATIIPANVVEEIKQEAKAEDNAITVIQPPFVPNSVARKPEVNVLEWARKRRAEHAHNAFNMAKIFRDTDFVINMDNTAMSPAIRQNEYLFLSSLDEGTKIIDGKAYGIETVAWGILIRRLYDNGDSILAKPENTLKFGSITIPKDEVVNIYHIKFRGATTLPPDTTDEAERLKQLRQQGEQISSLIDELGKAGSRQDRLISMLEKKQ